MVCLERDRVTATTNLPLHYFFFLINGFETTKLLTLKPMSSVKLFQLCVFTLHPGKNTKKWEQVSDCSGLLLTDNPQPGVAGAKTKNLHLPPRPRGQWPEETPTGEKTGVINSQLLAQAACWKLDKLKNKLNVKILRKEVSGWMGGKLTTQCSKLKTDHSEETNAEMAHI